MGPDPNQMTPEEYAEYLRQKRMAEEMRQQRGGGGPSMSPGMVAQFAGGGGEGAGGAAAGAWPAALAAAIIGNEMWATKEGRRPDDKGDHLKAALTGEVLEMDSENIEKMIGGGRATRKLGELGNPEGVLRNLRKMSMPWEWF